MEDLKDLICLDKERVKRVIEELQVDESGKGDFVISDVKKLKERLGIE